MGYATSFARIPSLRWCAFLQHAPLKRTCSLSLDVYINLLARLPHPRSYVSLPVFLTKKIGIRYYGCCSPLSKTSNPYDDVRFCTFFRYLVKSTSTPLDESPVLHFWTTQNLCPLHPWLAALGKLVPKSKTEFIVIMFTIPEIVYAGGTYLCLTAAVPGKKTKEL